MNDNKNDFGYFGKGIDGYVHYNQSFNDNFKKNPKSFKKKNAGCASAVIMILTFFCLIFFIIFHLL